MTNVICFLEAIISQAEQPIQNMVNYDTIKLQNITWKIHFILFKGVLCCLKRFWGS